MTRREAREHCFKMLFCQDFYPAEEKAEQIGRYFEAPLEDETTKDGIDVVLHEVAVKEEDKKELEEKVERILSFIPEIDEAINAVSEGWKVKLPISSHLCAPPASFPIIFTKASKTRLPIYINQYNFSKSL